MAVRQFPPPPAFSFSSGRWWVEVLHFFYLFSTEKREVKRLFEEPDLNTAVLSAGRSLVSFH